MSWKLTEKRLEKALSMLEAQHSLASIASALYITPRTLSAKLKEAGVEYKTVQDVGLRKLRVRAFEDIGAIEEPSRRVKAALDYLGRYERSEDVVTEDTVVLKIV